MAFRYGNTTTRMSSKTHDYSHKHFTCHFNNLACPPNCIIVNFLETPDNSMQDFQQDDTMTMVGPMWNGSGWWNGEWRHGQKHDFLHNKVTTLISFTCLILVATIHFLHAPTQLSMLFPTLLTLIFKPTFSHWIPLAPHIFLRISFGVRSLDGKGKVLLCFHNTHRHYW